ncbi:MAG: hypothetical protein KKE29_21470 [Proteobacteria bacterium]|nr:hypothetical protein [Pseudomonadota bacterium]MBU4599143.1 hypothetical protein [Pseudomonadota bacterium]
MTSSWSQQFAETEEITTMQAGESEEVDVEVQCVVEGESGGAQASHPWNRANADVEDSADSAQETITEYSEPPLPSLAEVCPQLIQEGEIKARLEQFINDFSQEISEVERLTEGKDLREAGNRLRGMDALSAQIVQAKAELKTISAEADTMIRDDLSDGKDLLKVLLVGSKQQSGTDEEVGTAAGWLADAKTAFEGGDRVAAALQGHRAVQVLRDLSERMIRDGLDAARVRLARF